MKKIKKYKLLPFIILFLILNTMYFWEGYLSFLVMPLTFALIIFYLILLFKFLKQLMKVIKYKFKNKKRIILTITMLSLLIVMFVFPYGIINYRNLEKNVLVAYQEGVAGCGTTLKLRANNKFIFTSYCFGITEVKGDYKYQNDTVFFNDFSNERLQEYDFGIIEKGGNGEIINLYQIDNDTIKLSYWLSIKENKLKYGFIEK